MGLAETTPTWALTLAYWLHMLATVVWIGGLASLVLLVLPPAQESLQPDQLADLMSRIQKRLDPLAWFCLVILVATGLFQMSANPNYDGFMAFNNSWAVSILVKHILFLAMVLLAAYQTWWLLPALRRESLRSSAPTTSRGTSAFPIHQRVYWLSRLNLVIAILVLLATAFARSA